MIIEAKDITKRFGKFIAIEKVSFAVDVGEIVGFVGANGAGKSTTITTLLGFINPSEGGVKLFGEPVTARTAHISHQDIGYAAGDMELPGSLTGAQYFDFVTAQYKTKSKKSEKTDKSDSKARRKELCARFQPQLDKKIKSLSRGNKQKIALIAAFLSSPELIILDEPTSGLDPLMQERFLELIKLEQKAGNTVFMSSHYLTEVADVCSRVILMRAGKIIEDLPALELFERSGKHVRVTTPEVVRPPEEAREVHYEKSDNFQAVQFIWNGTAKDLQHWVSGIDELQDIEISDHNLDAAFKQLYENEEIDEPVV